MTSRQPNRHGFTLMEILVALFIGGMLISAGRMLFDTAIDAQHRLESRVSRTSARNAAISEMQRAVRTVRPLEEIPFSGNSDSVSFAGWCPDGYGGRARCRVLISAKPVLAIEEQFGGSAQQKWVADSSGGRLDFVTDAASGDETVDGWESASSAPLAIRWISLGEHGEAGDTLVFEILRSGP